MNPRGIHLRYTFESRGQSGAEIENPLFELLQALQVQGSISQAASALGQSYRHVWGSLKHWESVLGNPLVLWAKGRHARLTPFAERLVWAERQARARMTPHVEALRSELNRVFALADDPGLQLLEVFASHDLGLPRLQLLAEKQHALHIHLRFAGSEEALRSLHDGRCSVAGFHVPRLPTGSRLFARALRPLLKPGTHKLIGSHWRRQGLMLRPAAAGAGGRGPLQGLVSAELLPALARGQGRFVNRQPGSGTRLLLDHLLHEAGLASEGIDGYATRVEQTHVAVAAAVAAGAADAGLGIEAAAREFGLEFHPLADEDYFLVCLKHALDTPAVASLRAALASPAWALALQALPGYGVQRPGEVLSLTRALPWWNFKRRNASAPAAAAPAAIAPPPVNATPATA
jgi:molybdate transport repressor ModE-like protein